MTWVGYKHKNFLVTPLLNPLFYHEFESYLILVDLPTILRLQTQGKDQVGATADPKRDELFEGPLRLRQSDPCV